MAAAAGNLAMVEMLLDSGANPLIEDKNDKTPAELTSNEKIQELIMDRQLAMLAQLMEPLSPETGAAPKTREETLDGYLQVLGEKLRNEGVSEAMLATIIDSPPPTGQKVRTARAVSPPKG